MKKSDPKLNEEKAFNETLKRMLKSPPKPHDKAANEKDGDKKSPPSVSKG